MYYQLSDMSKQKTKYLISSKLDSVITFLPENDPKLPSVKFLDKNICFQQNSKNQH